MSLENPVPNRPQPPRTCKECANFDRFGIPAVARIEGECQCYTRVLDVCPEHKKDADSGRVYCGECHESVQFTTVELIDASR